MTNPRYIVTDTLAISFNKTGTGCKGMRFFNITNAGTYKMMKKSEDYNVLNVTNTEDGEDVYVSINDEMYLFKMTFFSNGFDVDVFQGINMELVSSLTVTTPSPVVEAMAEAKGVPTQPVIEPTLETIPF